MRRPAMVLARPVRHPAQPAIQLCCQTTTGPAIPRVITGADRAPARQAAAPASMARAVARAAAPVRPVAEPAVLAAEQVAGQAKAANDMPSLAAFCDLRPTSA
ncbi:hypothetical protein EMIT0P43_10329 [Pseudomonas jessenii]